MMYRWTDDIIRFMEDASCCSNYFVKLADFLEPYLKGCKTICDAGCGLGQLSEELGKRGYLVYSCDSSENAINYVRKRNYYNVVPLLEDLHIWQPKEKFDAMIFNYFGSMEEILEIAKKCCNGNVLTIKKNYRFHRFSFTKNPIRGHMSQTAEEYLNNNNISFFSREFEAEFGQPFRSLEDAVLFFNIYSRDSDRSIITKDNVQKLLVPYMQGEFKFYLPQKKPSLLIVTEVLHGRTL